MRQKKNWSFKNQKRRLANSDDKKWTVQYGVGSSDKSLRPLMAKLKSLGNSYTFEHRKRERKSPIYFLKCHFGCFVERSAWLCSSSI